LGNVNLKWWQVLGFFAAFAGYIWYSSSKEIDMQANDVEERVNDLRRAACECPDQDCANAVALQLVGYLDSIKGREAAQDRVDFIESLSDDAADCINDPSKRRPDPYANMDNIIKNALPQITSDAMQMEAGPSTNSKSRVDERSALEEPTEQPLAP